MRRQTAISLGCASIHGRRSIRAPNGKAHEQPSAGEIINDLDRRALAHRDNSKKGPARREVATYTGTGSEILSDASRKEVVDPPLAPKGGGKQLRGPQAPLTPHPLPRRATP